MTRRNCVDCCRRLPPRLILRALLEALLFLCGIVLGAWLIFRFRRHLQDGNAGQEGRPSPRERRPVSAGEEHTGPDCEVCAAARALAADRGAEVRPEQVTYDAEVTRLVDAGCSPAIAHQAAAPVSALARSEEQEQVPLVLVNGGGAYTLVLAEAVAGDGGPRQCPGEWACGHRRLPTLRRRRRGGRRHVRGSGSLRAGPGTRDGPASGQGAGRLRWSRCVLAAGLVTFVPGLGA
jgi:hypothetical protein